MSDKKHRELMNRFIETCLEGLSNTSVEVEQPYNYYGSRGVVDIVQKTVFKTFSLFQLIECKPKLDDVGEAIRQVNRQEKYFPLDHNITKPDEVVSYLLFPFTKHNWEIFDANSGLFRRVNKIIFFPEEEKVLRGFKDVKNCSIIERTMKEAYFKQQR